MNGTFVLTVDVEIDAGKKWHTRNPASYVGVLVGIGRLQTLCERYGVRPVYLISPRRNGRPESVTCLNALDRTKCELGAHLHGEYIGPSAKYPNVQSLGNFQGAGAPGVPRWQSRPHADAVS
jgi:hypothetical protein